MSNTLFTDLEAVVEPESCHDARQPASCRPTLL